MTTLIPTTTTTIFQSSSDVFQRYMKLNLLKAGKDGLLNRIIEYINQGVPIDTFDNLLHDTVLHYAACYGYIDIVEYITQACRVDVNTMKNRLDQTALHVACRYGQLTIVQYLTKRCNANVEAKSLGVGTALHCACLGTTASLDVVKFLIKECNANVDERTLSGMTPLHVAIARGNVSIVQYLLDECQADITAITRNGENVFDIANQSVHQYRNDLIVYLLRTIRGYDN